MRAGRRRFSYVRVRGAVVWARRRRSARASGHVGRREIRLLVLFLMQSKRLSDSLHPGKKVLDSMQFFSHQCFLCLPCSVIIMHLLSSYILESMHFLLVLYSIPLLHCSTTPHHCSGVRERVLDYLLIVKHPLQLS